MQASEPAPLGGIRDAATVIVVREGAAGIELFCVERHSRSGFLGGAIVFPGGKVDPGDRGPAWKNLTTGLSARARGFADDEDLAMSLTVAALRELLEEAAILPVVGDGVDAVRALALRGELAERENSGADRTRAFAELLERHGLCADTLRLEPLWRWITPTVEPRRFDTRFYLMPLPPGQSGQHDRLETTSSFWATPEEVLARWERGEIFLAPPTSRSAELFCGKNRLAQARELALRQSLEPVCPVFVMESELSVLALPGDPLYPERLPAPPDPEAPTRFVLEKGRFVARRVVGG
jgi:8-oxo-dGTP pyrophosphatase MutT (NUDIX family)